MATSSNVSAGQDATAEQYNNLRADVFGSHHSDPEGTLLVNADISPTAGIALSKLAALTANRALVTNGSGVIVVSAVTATELGYLSGIVSKPVCNSGDETIAGVKTFSSIPILPASDPTSDNQASRKAYVDLRSKFQAGGFLFASANTEKEASNLHTTYTKKKEIGIGKGGTLRIYWEMRHSSGVYYVYAKVYRNGSPVGTEKSTNSSTYVPFQEDISGWETGDVVQLYCRTDGYASGYVRNFRIYVTNAEKYSVNLD